MTARGRLGGNESGWPGLAIRITVPVWFALVGLVILFSGPTIRNEVSLGEILALLIIPIISITAWLVRWYRKRHPVKIRWVKDDYSERRVLVLRPNETRDVTVVLFMRQRRRLEEFVALCDGRHWLSVDMVDSGASIGSLLISDRQPDDLRRWDAGWGGRLPDPVEFDEGGRIYLRLRVTTASAQWHGRIIVKLFAQHETARDAVLTFKVR